MAKEKSVAELTAADFHRLNEANKARKRDTITALNALVAEVTTVEASPSHAVQRSRLPKYDRQLLISLAESRSRLQTVDSRFFEELIFDLLVEAGYKDAKLVKQHNAPGPDIVAVAPKDSGLLTVVEVKRWKDKVGLDVVRKLTSMADYDYGGTPTKGMIVTSSCFSREARRWVERHFLSWRLSLIDGSDVQRMLSSALTPIEETVRHHNISRRLTYHIHHAEESRGSQASIRPANHLCQRCGGPVVCVEFVHDEGTGGWMDDKDVFDFFHICRACVYTNVSWQSFTIDLGEYPIHNPCPFCESAEKRMLRCDWGNIRFADNQSMEV